MNLKNAALILFLMVGLTAKAADPGREVELGRMKLDTMPRKGYSEGDGIEVNKNAVTVNAPATVWKGHWNAGQIKVPGNAKITLKAEVRATTPIFQLQAYGGKMLPAPDQVRQEGNIYELTWNLENSPSIILSALWVTMPRKTPETAFVKILELSVWQRIFKNAVDADRILQTPPKHKAELKMHNGSMTLFIDDLPISGQMWSHICYHNVTDKYLQTVLNGLNYPIAAIPFAVGENRLTRLYPTSWLGEDEYDWSYIDTQAQRVLKARPDAKLILMLALDGAKWWTDMYPDAANLEVDAELTPRFPGSKGVPDYLSERWKKQQRKLLRQLVAHVQSSEWGKSVIGYELFNGGSMDCNFMIPHGNARVIADFRAFLKQKYKNDHALQKAWNNPAVTIATAKPWNGDVPTGLILAPAENKCFIDTRTLLSEQFRQVFSEFASVIKEATCRRALVGARSGDFMGNFGWNGRWTKIGEDSGWLPPLLNDPNFDYFDVQEPYPGRQLGDGAGVPVIPPAALAKYGKTIFIQNDVRTHLSKPGIGYGRTPDLASTIQLQRRVFVNSLTSNMIPYLFQLDFRYDQPELLAEYRKQEEILKQALNKDRSSCAEVAVVLDPEMRRFLGRDDRYSAPTRYFVLFDFAKHVWQRGGAPFDMVFLDQLADLPPYRVYVFYNTWQFSEKQMQMIREKVFANGQTAVFLWSDGLIQANGKFSTDSLESLTGMKIQLSNESTNWKLNSSAEFTRLLNIPEGSEVGIMQKRYYDACAPNSGDWLFEPSFKIEADAKTIPLAYRPDGSLGMAMRQMKNYQVIYSVSGNLTESLFRLAANRAGVFKYTDSSALLMMNRSYLAIHANENETIQLKLPEPQRLVNSFTGEELPLGTIHQIPVEKNHTYLFERK